MRVFELADELGVRSVDVLDACDDCGVRGMDAGAELTDDQAKRVRFTFNQRAAAAMLSAAAEAAPPPAWQPYPTHPPEPTGAWSPGSGPGAAPLVAPEPPGTPVPRGRSKGMHPLIKRSLWHLGLAQVVPCFGLYFLISALVNAGKGRRQIAWSNQRYDGDTAGLVVQIVCWIELGLMLLAVLYVLSTAGGSSSP